MSGEPDPCPYGLCDGSGFVIDEERGIAVDCRCRPARIAAARVRALEGRVPRKYRDVSFDRFPVTEIAPPIVREVRRFTDQIDARVDAGRGIWFVGDTGTGKTTLAMLVSKAAMEANRTVAIYSLPRLMNLLRDAIESENGLLGLLDRLASVDVLHLDDLGVEHRTDWAIEQLYTIVNTRYEDQRSLILTSNVEAEDLKDQIGLRTYSRIIEMCGDPLPLYGDDQRQQIRSA